MKAAIIGGTGFIGSKLAHALRLRGDDVLTISRGMNPSNPLPDARLDICSVSVSELTRILGDQDLVFYLAGLVDVSGAIRDPMTAFSTDTMGCLKALEAVRTTKPSRFVYVSSARVYSDSRTPLREDAHCSPKEPYGAAKLASEALISSYGLTYKIPSVIVRPFSVYGPGLKPKQNSSSGVVSTFTREALEGKKLTILGSGAETKDFVYIADVIDALIQVAVRDETIGEVLNIASGSPTSIRKLAELILDILGKNWVGNTEYLPAPIEVTTKMADVTKIRTLIGWTASTKLEDGLRSYVRWFSDTFAGALRS